MYEQVQEEYRPPSHIICKWCDKPIFIGDRSVLLHHGIIGRGKKSGQPLVTDDELTSGEAVVHELCAISYLVMNIVDSAEEAENVIDTVTADMFGISYSELRNEDNLCSACEAKIEDD